MGSAQSSLPTLAWRPACPSDLPEVKRLDDTTLPAGTESVIVMRHEDKPTSSSTIVYQLPLVGGFEAKTDRRNDEAEVIRAIPRLVVETTLVHVGKYLRNLHARTPWYHSRQVWH